MYITVYDTLQIKHTYTYSCLDEDHDNFYNRTETQELSMSAVKFLEDILAFSLKQSAFFHFAINENVIELSFFDPLTGHSEDHSYEITKI